MLAQLLGSFRFHRSVAYRHTPGDPWLAARSGRGKSARLPRSMKGGGGQFCFVSPAPSRPRRPTELRGGRRFIPQSAALILLAIPRGSLLAREARSLDEIRCRAGLVDIGDGIDRGLCDASHGSRAAQREADGEGDGERRGGVARRVCGVHFSSLSLANASARTAAGLQSAWRPANGRSSNPARDLLFYVSTKREPRDCYAPRSHCCSASSSRPPLPAASPASLVTIRR